MSEFCIYYEQMLTEIAIILSCINLILIEQPLQMNVLKQCGVILTASRLMYSWLFVCDSKWSDCRENVPHITDHVIFSYHLNQEISYWINKLT